VRACLFAFLADHGLELVGVGEDWRRGRRSDCGVASEVGEKEVF
jgi:hypothetical protein